MSQNVRLQNLRDFTVQIRRVVDDAAEGDIIGTGVAVSMDGKIVTCAHVAEGALGVHPRQANGAEVGVYFPQARGGETKSRRAKVAACFSQHDDDVVLLQLTGGPSPLAPEQVVRLGKAQASDGHPFRSYGYRSLGKYEAGYAYGRILGCVECPEGLALQADPVQLESQHISPGMSGSPVLDIERNLVVGVISETWYTDQLGKDRDTGWAVDAHVLTFDPLNLPVQDEPFAMRPAPQPRADADQVRAAIGPKERIAWNNAPPKLAEWVGRDDLLRSITADWADPNRRVTGLIGFGGEGKSSLARKWVDDLLSPLPSYSTGEGAGVGAQPDGVFWWGFYEKPSADEFFEAALKYMSGDRIDPRAMPSANAKAHFIAAMLATGRYLFVLDGLEVMQHQEGDQYGLLKSADLREFLSYFAAPAHASFCLVTSRAPLLDLMEYTTYTHRDVNRLTPADGRALLRKLGVGQDAILPHDHLDAALDKLVADWDGHALTLSLLSGLLVEQYGGDVAHVADLPAPVAGAPRYERVHRVLRRYDEHLDESERAFLTLFSAFRTPVHESAFEKVFRPLLKTFEVLETSKVYELVNRLVTYRILRHDTNENTYTTHPLIRAHYFTLLTQGDPSQTQAAHERIKDYYLSIADDTPQYPTLDDLRPLIEVVHHACQAGVYDEAVNILWQRIYQHDRFAIYHELGAYETGLTLLFEFFPNGSTSQEPQVSDPMQKSWILNEVGLCLMCLGRLGEAPPFYERAVTGDLEMQDWHNAGTGYQNLAGLYAYLGELARSTQAAQQALDLARRAENKQNERTALTGQAWAAHLRGKLDAAGAAFAQAEALEQEIDPNGRYLYSLNGIQHADHLRRIGQADYARRVTEANIKSCEQYHWVNDLSRSYRILGDLDADISSPGRRRAWGEVARGHYDEALKIARSISLDVLIEALLARGRFFARRPDLSGLAFNDLNEALGYVLVGGYRIYEADIRVALAWAHLALSPKLAAGQPPSPEIGRGELEAARAEAERALQMSEDMGYYWGKVDAEEVSKEME